jgi:hypothetical protein
MQCCHVFCNKTALKNYFTSLEKFALIFSGLCHDVAHTGHNNVFEMNCLSKLSLRYHDKSVISKIKFMYLYFFLMFSIGFRTTSFSHNLQDFTH